MPQALPRRSLQHQVARRHHKPALCPRLHGRHLHLHQSALAYTHVEPCPVQSQPSPRLAFEQPIAHEDRGATPRRRRRRSAPLGREAERALALEPRPRLARVAGAPARSIRRAHLRALLATSISQMCSKHPPHRGRIQPPIRGPLAPRPRRCRPETRLPRSSQPRGASPSCHRLQPAERLAQ